MRPVRPRLPAAKQVAVRPPPGPPPRPWPCHAASERARPYQSSSVARARPKEEGVREGRVKLPDPVLVQAQ